MAEVRLKNVKKVYDNTVVAVQDFNMTIRDQEFVVLVGPSGCGKSTTLRMIAGLEEITGGEIYIGDTLVNDLPPKDRDIAMVFQNYALYPHMTVYENMAFSLKLRGEKKLVIDAKVKEAAELLGISDLLKRKPKALSGGQRQRVAIGRAIVRNPQVFLMDEPLSNLDAKLRNQMRGELIRLRQRLNTTFVYVTHDQTEAMTLGDRIVVMKDGFVQQIGTPKEVFETPANAFVAGFIGTPQMNFFSGKLLRGSNAYVLEVGGMCIPLNADTQQRLLEKDVPACMVTVGVRPEFIRHAAPGEQFIPGTIEMCEILGSVIYLHVSGAVAEAVISISVDEANAEDLHNGTPFNFTFAESAIHIFDAETGVRL